jgi:hypothetical protein
VAYQNDSEIFCIVNAVVAIAMLKFGASVLKAIKKTLKAQLLKR